MNQRKSEIHMHSTFSDGQFTPTELIEIAIKNKVQILSLTDHDTFEGIGEFLSAADNYEIFAFPGIEITVRYRDFNLHLLGYFKSWESLSEAFRNRVETMKNQREDRMHQMIELVNTVIPESFSGKIFFENVRRACEGVIGRPHLAREMVRLGIVKTTPEAFERYLVKYNVEKNNISIQEALDLIRSSHGVPILAHPGERTYSLHNPTKGRGFEDVPPMVEELKAMGLMGLECIYPYHEKTGKVKFFLELADRFDLIATGSRDFHGFHTNQSQSIFGTTPIGDSYLSRFHEVWG